MLHLILRRPPVTEWITGEKPGPKWDDQFDTFVDFTASVVGGFLPWLLRASETLAGVIGGWAADVPWREWAERLESRDRDDALGVVDL
jgi:hypothetical protein